MTNEEAMHYETTPSDSTTTGRLCFERAMLYVGVYEGGDEGSGQL